MHLFALSSSLLLLVSSLPLHFYPPWHRHPTRFPTAYLSRFFWPGAACRQSSIEHQKGLCSEGANAGGQREEEEGGAGKVTGTRCPRPRTGRGAGSDPHQVPENPCPQQSPIPDAGVREGVMQLWWGQELPALGPQHPPLGPPDPPLGPPDPSHLWAHPTSGDRGSASLSSAVGSSSRTFPREHPPGTPALDRSEPAPPQGMAKAVQIFTPPAPSCACPPAPRRPLPLSGSHAGEGAPRRLQMNDNEIQSLLFSAFPLPACPKKLSSQL